jgi:hypothetical protein
MKGKYITTSLRLAVLSGGTHGTTVLVDEIKATTLDHQLIWSKTVAAAKMTMMETQGVDELKTA